MADDEILALARSLQHAAPLDLRVNTLKAPRQAVLDRLEADGTPAVPTRFSPIGVRLKEKIALNKHPMFLDGAVEVQDEGSQILGLLVEPRRTDMVVDFCAGAGGKTLQLGAAMGSHGRLYAYDVSDKRLANLAPRLRRSGLSNVHPQRISGENDTKVKRLRGKVDRVLVDAPCTGLGTLRRNPDLKSRQTESRARGTEREAVRHPRGGGRARETGRPARVRHLQPARGGERGHRRRASSPRTRTSPSSRAPRCWRGKASRSPDASATCACSRTCTTPTASSPR